MRKKIKKWEREKKVRTKNKEWEEERVCIEWNGKNKERKKKDKETQKE